MKRRVTLSMTLLTLVAFVGCQVWTKIEVEPQEIANGYTVHPDREWSRMKLKYVDLWTDHGAPLEDLRLTRGLKDGQPLHEPPDRDIEMPTYRSTMTASEIMEMVEDTLGRIGAVDLNALGLRPEPFAGKDGFRFSLTYVNEAGLRFRGTAAGAVHDERLYLVLFTAPELHYFPKYGASVDALIASATIEAD